MSFTRAFVPAVSAHAHCDIPCSIYDPTPAKIAAKTVARMVDLINDIDLPNDWNDADAVRHYMNDVGRRIAVKEEHAETCKREVEILWSDFFKPEHGEQFPELHEKVWKTVKLCSQNKQSVDAEKANELVALVDEIAEAFYNVKGVPERLKAYKEVTDNLY